MKLLVCFLHHFTIKELTGGSWIWTRWLSSRFCASCPSTDCRWGPSSDTREAYTRAFAYTEYLRVSQPETLILTKKKKFLTDILSLGNNGILVFIGYKPYWFVINYAVAHSVHLSADLPSLFPVLNSTLLSLVIQLNWLSNMWVFVRSFLGMELLFPSLQRLGRESWTCWPSSQNKDICSRGCDLCLPPTPPSLYHVGPCPGVLTVTPSLLPHFHSRGPFLNCSLQEGSKETKVLVSTKCHQASPPPRLCLSILFWKLSMLMVNLNI